MEYRIYFLIAFPGVVQMKYAPHEPRYLNTLSPAGGSVWRSFERVRLTVEKNVTGGRF